VQNGTAFGNVDGITAPHGIDALTQARGLGEADEKAQPVGVEMLAREVQVQATGFAGEPFAACRIGSAQRSQAHRMRFIGSRTQGAPGGGQFFMGHRGRCLLLEIGRDGIDNVLKLRLFELGIDRQRQALERGPQ
jgi:hypothetical protein